MCQEIQPALRLRSTQRPSGSCPTSHCPGQSRGHLSARHCSGLITGPLFLLLSLPLAQPGGSAVQKSRRQALCLLRPGSRKDRGPGLSCPLPRPGGGACPLLATWGSCLTRKLPTGSVVPDARAPSVPLLRQHARSVPTRGGTCPQTPPHLPPSKFKSLPPCGLPSRRPCSAARNPWPSSRSSACPGFRSPGAHGS